MAYFLGQPRIFGATMVRAKKAVGYGICDENFAYLRYQHGITMSGRFFCLPGDWRKQFAGVLYRFIIVSNFYLDLRVAEVQNLDPT